MVAAAKSWLMVDGDTFRQVLGSFATGVTVVTFPSDPPHGLTANAFSSVSLDPPLVLVCVDHDTESYSLLTEGGIKEFCVNILAEGQQHLGEYFANMRELDESPFDTEETSTAETGTPVFDESLAYIDCTVWDSHRAGDHTIYIGEVAEASILNPDTPALTFFRGQWGTLT